jgi:hypothetical protein
MVRSRSSELAEGVREPTRSGGRSGRAACGLAAAQAEQDRARWHSKHGRVRGE